MNFRSADEKRGFGYEPEAERIVNIRMEKVENM